MVFKEKAFVENFFSSKRVRSLKGLSLLLLFFLVFATGCGGGKDEDTPPAAGNAILPSADTMFPPTILSPNSALYSSQDTLITLSGNCTVAPGSKVVLGGDANQSTACSDQGLYTFVISKPADGTYRFTLKQESRTMHASQYAYFTWIKTSAPIDDPVITTPSYSPFTSTNNAFVLSGTCTAGYTVLVTGTMTQTSTCTAGGTFSATYNNSNDGTYNFNVAQRSPGGRTSNLVPVTWIRAGGKPLSPVITNPSGGSYTGSEAQLTISGTCPSNTTVKTAGAETLSVPCSGGTFEFTLNQNTYAIFTYTITAVSTANVSSDPVTFLWTRNSASLPVPVLTSPAPTTLTNNLNQLVISGSCIDGATVHVDGDETLSTTCSSSSFSFSIDKLNGTADDGTFVYQVSQSNGAVTSGSVQVSWTRDTVAPLAPNVTLPVSPFATNLETFQITGSCDSGNLVYMAGDATDSTTCASNSFTFSVNKTTDASYSVNFSQKDAAGNFSPSSADFNWTLDNAAPEAPTITTPSTSPHITNTNSITVSGNCSAYKVWLTGVNSNSVVCTGGTYTFTVTDSTDGTHDLIVHQTDLAGNISPTVTKQWERDTVKPDAPVITSPAQSSITSSSGFNVSGTCETGATIVVSGAQSDSSKICTAGAWDFDLVQSPDGTYNYTFKQRDIAGNLSLTGATLTWIKSDTTPAPPVIDTPATNPFYGKLTALTIEGTCVTGNTVNISGAESLPSTTCTTGRFSFNLSKSTDGTYVYNITQTYTDLLSATHTSAAATFTWNLDTTPPAALTIVSPAASPHYSSTSSLILNGTCEANSAITFVGGTDSGPATCNGSGTFTVTLNQTSDGSYSYSLQQTDQAGNISAATIFVWNRDTVAPAEPALISPATNNFVSGDTNLLIKVSCETGASLFVNGATTPTGTCSATNDFSYTATQTANGSYTYSFMQKDRALNPSSVLNFYWTRDDTTPFTPSVMAPTTTGSYFSNTTSLTVEVTCLGGQTPPIVVHMTGVAATDVTSPSNSLSQNCPTNGRAFFTITKTVDATYSLGFKQENTSNFNFSAETFYSWTLDRVAPAQVTLTNPASGSITSPGTLTIAGTCEVNANVDLTGDATQNWTCADGTFTFTVDKGADGTYNFVLKQTDRAGNISANRAVQWVRDASSVGPPVITSANPYISKTNPFNITGTCTPTYTLTLAGVTAAEVTSPAGTLTQTCPAGGTFSYVINKATDGTAAMSVMQTFSGHNSSPAPFTLTLDSTPPTVTLSGKPSDPNILSTATFTFSANETATFQCKLNTGTFQACTSPFNIATITNGSSTFTIKATDSAGNVNTTDTTYTWVQAYYKTVGLYHMDGATTTTAYADSGSYTSYAPLAGAFNNNLVVNAGTPALNATGNFLQGITLTGGASLKVTRAVSDTTLATFVPLRKTMVVEGFFKFGIGSPTAGNYTTIYSHSGTAASNYGWQLVLYNYSGVNGQTCKTGQATYQLVMRGSTDNGATMVELARSSCLTLVTNKFTYIAISWNLGALSLYYTTNTAKSAAVATATIGTVNVTELNIPTSMDFKIGTGPATGAGTATNLDAIVDEVRISNFARTVVPPAAAYTAD